MNDNVNKKVSERIAQLEEWKTKAHLLPWSWSANVSFNVQVAKPRPSLSKHDSERPNYFHYDDGCYFGD